MSTKYREFPGLNLPSIEQEILAKWEKSRAFERSVELRDGAESFVFYEGPPSANGMPGIHHVIGRTLKDLVCRYKTMRGYQVRRKGGWDTHGLPVELGVEKELGITKEDIGKKISVEEYNRKCREAVMRYKDQWEDLTRKMGYWVDLKDPYITFENSYIETLWWLLKKLYKKGLLYESVSIQPYSPAAGTGLSSHELNQPGTYKDVKDTSCVAMFNVVKNEKSKFLFDAAKSNEIFFLAWTTTPWTLPSNLGLTLGPKIEYVLVKLWNQYASKWFSGIVAKDLLYNKILVGKYFEDLIIKTVFGGVVNSMIGSMGGRRNVDGFIDIADKRYDIEVKTGNGDEESLKRLTTFAKESGNDGGMYYTHFPVENALKQKHPNILFDNFQNNILGKYKGSRFEGVSYEQLLPFEANKTDNPNAFKVLLGDFVTTEEGTGIVHTAPAFGADDFKRLQVP